MINLAMINEVLFCVYSVLYGINLSKHLLYELSNYVSRSIKDRRAHGGLLLVIVSFWISSAIVYTYTIAVYHQ